MEPLASFLMERLQFPGGRYARAVARYVQSIVEAEGKTSLIIAELGLSTPERERERGRERERE